MSSRRWQFWLFAGVIAYALIPVVEELVFRGYYQRRLAYNATMIASLFCFAIGLGVVFAWTRSLIPSMVAHAIINVPMTPPWQGALLVVFAIGGFFAWRGGVAAVKQVFTNTRVAACTVLAVAQTLYVIKTHRINGITQIAIGMSQSRQPSVTWAANRSCVWPSMTNSK